MKQPNPHRIRNLRAAIYEQQLQIRGLKKARALRKDLQKRLVELRTIQLQREIRKDRRAKKANP